MKPTHLTIPILKDLLMPIPGNITRIRILYASLKISWYFVVFYREVLPGVISPLSLSIVLKLLGKKNILFAFPFLPSEQCGAGFLDFLKEFAEFLLSISLPLRCGDSNSKQEACRESRTHCSVRTKEMRFLEAAPTPEYPQCDVY